MKKKERRYNLDVSVNKKDDEEEGGLGSWFQSSGAKGAKPYQKCRPRFRVNDRADVGK